MEVGRSLHQRHGVPRSTPVAGLDGRNEPMENGTELGAFGRRHFTEIPQMPLSHLPRIYGC